MNFDNIGSGSLGGAIGGSLILLKDLLFGVNKRLSKVEKKLDEVVNHKTCEAIREDTKEHIKSMNEDMKYMRSRLDEVLMNVSRHREDYK